MSTIREVAALAGVSAATVSRVINHDTQYSMTEETRERVWKAIARLNYQAPVSPESGKESSKSRTPKVENKSLGVIMTARGGKYSDPYYMSILAGFEKRIMEYGYGIDFIRTANELYNPQIIRNTFHTKVAGVLLMNTLDKETFDFIGENVEHIVGIDTNHKEIDNVEYDHYAVCETAIAHLAKKGYKRIGFIAGAESELETSRRFRGYYASLKAHNLEYNPAWVLCPGWDDEKCIRMIKEKYESGNLPEAYFASSDLMAMTVERALLNLGLKIPKDVAVMGLTNIETSKFANPSLTTIEVKTEAMGEIAAELLLSRIKKGPHIPVRMNVESTLVVRDST